MFPAVVVLTKGASNVIRAKTLPCGVVLACSVFILTILSASADDKSDKGKPAFSGIWNLKGGETTIEFSDKNVVKIWPHGESNVIAVICEYTAEKEELVKAKISTFEGDEDAREKVKEILPVGTEFSFKWKLTDDVAKLDDVKCDKVEHLKSHLEGEYSRKR
jgi:hypothetical protein